MKLRTINTFLIVLICILSIACVFIFLYGNKHKTTIIIAKSETSANLQDSDRTISNFTTPQKKFKQSEDDETSILSIDNTYQQLLKKVQTGDKPATIKAESYFDYLFKKANAGDSESQYFLGISFLWGEGVPQNYSEAFNWFQKAAEQGNADAQCNLGFLYMNGKGVSKDNNKAIVWYHESAEQGNKWAQYFLGSMYAHGQGVIKDYNEAAKWYSMSAEQGFSLGEYSLGVMYHNGWGVIRNDKEAIKWYAKAAEQGLTTAQNNLGLMYDRGEGVPQDFQQAVKWYSKAAEQGHAGAEHNLGNSYRTGNGVQQDYQQAVNWYSKAAEQGLAEAQINLAVMYAIGDGVIEDYVEAYKWMLLAGKNFEDVSKIYELKKFLSNRMTAQQVAEAQRLAKQYVNNKEKQNNKSTFSEKQKNGLTSNLGTCFLVSHNGYFITAAHVVKDAKSLRIYWNSSEYQAEKVFTDEALDVAILKTVGIKSLQPLSLTSSSIVKTGDTVFTIGFPQVQLQGVEPKYTDGSISSLSGFSNDPKYFQISVPVQPGNSGGPLIDSNGNVVGLITARLDEINTLIETGSLPQNVNYALKSSFILPLLESLSDMQLEKANNLGKTEAIEQAKKAVALVVCIKESFYNNEEWFNPANNQ